MITEKQCSSCHEVKLLQAFSVHKRSKNGRRAQCKTCQVEYNKKWRSANPEYAPKYDKQYRKNNAERLREYNKKWYEANSEYIIERGKIWRMNNPHQVRVQNLKRYGITPKDYQALLDSQSGVCAICEKTCETGKRLSIDHNHKTGAVRGLLCHKCNAGIGFFLDSPKSLIAAAKYLKRFKDIEL